MRPFVPWILAASMLLATAAPAAGGWILERVTHTEGAAGPGSEVTLYIAGGRVKELHADGTYFLWDVPRGLLFQVDPSTKTYSGGSVKEMIAQVQRYLDDLREKLARLTDEQRQELARRAPGMPMPVPPPETPPAWSTKETSRTKTIAGREARLFEIHRDGVLFAEKWLAPDVSFGDDLDYHEFARWSRDLEGSFTAGMGGASPSGEEVDELYRQGVEMKQVLIGDGFRIVTEVKRLEPHDVPESTFHLPPDYTLKGAQVSRSRRPRTPAS
jgi:hypothetical protein